MSQHVEAVVTAAIACVANIRRAYHDVPNNPWLRQDTRDLVAAVDALMAEVAATSGCVDGGGKTTPEATPAAAFLASQQAEADFAVRTTLGAEAAAVIAEDDTRCHLMDRESRDGDLVHSRKCWCQQGMATAFLASQQADEPNRCPECQLLAAHKPTCTRPVSLPWENHAAKATGGVVTSTPVIGEHGCFVPTAAKPLPAPPTYGGRVVCGNVWRYPLNDDRVCIRDPQHLMPHRDCEDVAWDDDGEPVHGDEADA